MVSFCYTPSVQLMETSSAASKQQILHNQPLLPLQNETTFFMDQDGLWMMKTQSIQVPNAQKQSHLENNGYYYDHKLYCNHW